MRRGKGLNDKEKSVIKENIKDTSLYATGEKLGHYVDTVKILVLKKLFSTRLQSKASPSVDFHYFY